MDGGPAILRKPTTAKSNVELITSLRTNIQVAQEAVDDASPTTNGHAAPNGASHGFHLPPWVSKEDSTIYVPSVDWTLSGLAEERSQYDITVKLFYLPGVCPRRRLAHAKEALDVVLKELKVLSVDLLIVSFAGVVFDASAEDDSSDSSGCADYAESAVTDLNGSTDVEDIEMMMETWRTVEKLHAQGIVAKLGVAEFGSQLLARFLEHACVRPAVDQINLRDCCAVPKSLITLAKVEGIELLTHTDCVNILPADTVRDLLGHDRDGAGILDDLKRQNGHGPTTSVMPQWVVKYTAVIKDRGVVENKGYFAMVDVKDR